MAFKVLKFLTETFAWLQIAASPTLGGTILGGMIYAIKRDTIGLIVAIIVASAGIIIGIIWATKIRKKTGTVEFMSKVNATPELDNLEK